jgi:hypothetical protein
MTENPKPEIPTEAPAGMMRMWDPVAKKVVFVTAPPAGPDRLTFTLRIHDPLEKKDPAKSTSWVTLQIPREDLNMDEGHFIEKYIRPNLKELKLLALTSL